MIDERLTAGKRPLPTASCRIPASSPVVSPIAVRFTYQVVGSGPSPKTWRHHLEVGSVRQCPGLVARAAGLRVGLEQFVECCSARSGRDTRHFGIPVGTDPAHFKLIDARLEAEGFDQGWSG
jgi:hypothetical protein